MKTNRAPWSILGVTIALAGAAAPSQGQDPEPPPPFRVDDRAMCAFEYHLGEWVPGDPDAPPGIVIDFAWGIPGKTVVDREYRQVDGAAVQFTDGLAGYHYGLQEIEWISFVRDGLRPFEVMNIGRIDFEPGDVMVRRYRSYDPDTSSREYRETLTPLDENTRRNVIEYRDDKRNWQEWGVFLHVRRSERVRTPECAAVEDGEGGS